MGTFDCNLACIIFGTLTKIRLPKRRGAKKIYLVANHEPAGMQEMNYHTSRACYDGAPLDCLDAGAAHFCHQGVSYSKLYNDVTGFRLQESWIL